MVEFQLSDRLKMITRLKTADTIRMLEFQHVLTKLG